MLSLQEREHAQNKITVPSKVNRPEPAPAQAVHLKTTRMEVRSCAIEACHAHKQCVANPSRQMYFASHKCTINLIQMYKRNLRRCLAIKLKSNVAAKPQVASTAIAYMSWLFASQMII